MEREVGVCSSEQKGGGQWEGRRSLLGGYKSGSGYISAGRFHMAHRYQSADN